MLDAPSLTPQSRGGATLRLGLLRIAELWQKLLLGVDGKVLGQLMQGLRFADGQGQLWPLRVLALDARLRRPLRVAGCTVVVDEAQPPEGHVPASADLADALCALMTSGQPLPLVRGYARRVRQGGLVVLCSRPGSPPRALLAAALLHAGLCDIVQAPAGRMVLTAGRVATRGDLCRPGAGSEAASHTWPSS
jgi:hypothetical protein